MFTSITETPRSRFLRAYRTAGWGALALVVSIIAFSLTIAAYHYYIPEVLTASNLALVLLVLWAAYLGGRLAGARAHPKTDGAALVSIGEALVQVAASIERMQNAVADLHKLDVAERAAASTYLMQAKGALCEIRELTKRGGLTHSMIRATTRPLEAADAFLTDAIDELSGVRWETEEKAVDEAAAAVKH